MKPALKRFDPGCEYYFKEGCFITELANSPDDAGVSIARARVVPGESTRRHWLEGTTERYVVLEGRGRVEVDGLPPGEITAGDVVVIPPGCGQRVHNTGNTDLVFLAICSPRFTVAAYREG